MWVCEFIPKFHGKFQYYIQHVHMAQWQDEQLKLCRDTFPLGTISSVVDFNENYTLQPQNDTHSQYYLAHDCMWYGTLCSLVLNDNIDYVSHFVIIGCSFQQSPPLTILFQVGRYLYIVWTTHLATEPCGHVECNLGSFHGTLVWIRILTPSGKIN